VRGPRLRTRILLLALLNGALLAAGLAVFLRGELRPEFDSLLFAGTRERLETIARDLARDLRTTPLAEREPLLARLGAEHGARFHLVTGDGTSVAGPHDALPPEVRERLRGSRPGARPRPSRGGPPPRDAAARPGPARGGDAPPMPDAPPFLVVAAGDPAYWVGVRMPIHAAGEAEPVAGVLLLSARSFWTNRLFFDARPWLLLAAAAVAIGLACWLPFVAALTAEIERLRRGALEIARGRFDAVAPGSRGDELGELSRAVAEMGARLAGHVQGQKRFLADAAHELRSPLGRMQVALGILETRVAAADRPRLQDLAEEVERLIALTDELLAFARAELAAGARPPLVVAVADLASRAVQAEAKDGPSIAIEVAAELRVRVDPELARRALANLVRNAVRHGAGPIGIRAGSEGASAVIRVSDSGPGVPEASLPALFEPFYRVDPARQRGGTGLGLAIVRAAAEASGGSVVARNRTPHGLEVELRLPLA
jgi:two-component system sensor histidine kinase CpxA